MARVRAGVIATAIVTLIAVVGCSAPFTADLLAQAQDTTVPAVTVSTPADESFYAKTVLVQGSATDATDDPNVAGEIATLTYEIPAAGISESVDLADDGTFEFQFSTSAFTGDSITLVISAADANGNTGTLSRSLLYGGSDIATFSSVPGNQQVTLTWDAVPSSTGYTVRNLTLSEETTVAAAESTYVWSGLTNGESYFFELESTDGLGQVNTSTVVESIPLSQYTLMPRVENFANRVRLTWRSMPGVENYVVEKAEAFDGPYQRRDVLAANEFNDELLAREQFYYYRVHPLGQEDVKSVPVEALLVPFSAEGIEEGGYFGPLNATEYLVANGDYVYVTEENSDNDFELIVLDVSDPLTMTEVGRTTVGGLLILAAHVDPTDMIVYLSQEEGGLAAVDVSDPANPTTLTITDGVGSADFGYVDDAFFDGIGVVRISSTPYVVVSQYDGTVVMAQISRSGSIVTVTERDRASGSMGDDGGGLAIFGTDAYVGMEDGSGVGYDIIDVSTPTNIIRSTGYRIIDGNRPPKALFVTASTVYFGHRTGSGGAFRAISSADNSTEIASFSYPNEVLAITVSGGIAYAAAQTSGVFGYTESGLSGTSPPVVSVDPAGSAWSAEVVNGSLILAARVGVESFSLLELVGASSTKVTVTDAGANGNLTDFTSLGDQSHFIHLTRVYPADLSNMSAFPGISSFEAAIPGGGQAFLQGDRQIITDDYPTVNDLVATSIPGETAAEFGRSEGNSNTYFSVGDYTYGYSGAILTIHDTSDRTSFTRLRSIALDSTIRKILGQKNYLYVIESNAFTVLDISDPIAPVEVGSDTVAGMLGRINLEINDAELHDDKLYFAFHDDNGSTSGTDDAGGIAIWSVANPAVPAYVNAFTETAIYSDADSRVKQFADMEMVGHLAVLSSGNDANGLPFTGGQQYEGRIELYDISDPSAIYKVKDLLPDGGYVSSGTADFPEEIHVFRNRYVFAFGRLDLTWFEL